VQCVIRVVALVAALTVLVGGTSHACIGTACLEIFSTADGGGALTISWDFANRKIQLFGRCFPGGECLYSAIDPGFITQPGTPPEGFFQLADGTDVTLQIVAIDPAVTLKIEGVPLKAAGAAALLGTAPSLHEHPSWQLVVGEGERGDYPISFKLTTSSAAYAESAVFSVVVTNQPTPTPDEPSQTATATPTVTPPPASCPGDCDGNGVVIINELVSGVAAALDRPSTCKSACDLNHDGSVTVNELIAAVEAALNGCPATATPTATVPVSFAAIQSTIFSPRCALPVCHDSASHAGSLVLDDEHAYDQLVRATPSVETAANAGFLRVDPNHPDTSFLLVKLAGPPPDQGMRMPLGGPYLDAAEMQLIHDWIAQGASR